MVAQEPQARFIVADRFDDVTELAIKHPDKEQVAKGQGDGGGPEKADRDLCLVQVIKAGNVLQARKAVVAAQPAIILEQVQREREGHRHDLIGAFIHQPHADGVAADAKESKVAKAQNAARSRSGLSLWPRRGSSP